LYVCRRKQLSLYLKYDIMKLIDRLKPQYRENLEKYYERYPMIAESIYEELSNKEWIGDVKFSTVHNLQSACDYNYALSPYLMFNEYKI
jgi:hypothetical protein